MFSFFVQNRADTILPASPTLHLSHNEYFQITACGREVHISNPATAFSTGPQTLSGVHRGEQTWRDADKMRFPDLCTAITNSFTFCPTQSAQHSPIDHL
mgnify:CR=1 FL=1